MRAAAGQVPDEPGVDRAEQQLACLRARPRAGHVLKHPAELCAGKVSVEQQAGLFTEQGFESPRPQRVAVFRRAPALPDDRRADGLPCFLIPDDDRFTLVRDADGRHFGSVRTCFCKRLPRHLKLHGEDLLRVVLHPAGLGIMLRKLPLRDLHERLLPVEQDGAARCRALIQSEDIAFHLAWCSFPFLKGFEKEKRAGNAVRLRVPVLCFWNVILIDTLIIGAARRACQQQMRLFWALSARSDLAEDGIHLRARAGLPRPQDQRVPRGGGEAHETLHRLRILRKGHQKTDRHFRTHKRITSKNY